MHVNVSNSVVTEKSRISSVSHKKNLKKKAVADFQSGIVTEPVRRNRYELVNHNFNAVDRKIYIHRYIYVGEHSFHEKGLLIHEIFESVISLLNSGYYDEKLTGFLLYYPTYYCHIIEGSEDMINKHFLHLFRNSIHADCFGKTRIFTMAPHMRQRITDDWNNFTGVPPNLLEKPDPMAPFLELRSIVFSAVQKMYHLAIEVGKMKKLHACDDEEITEVTKQPTRTGLASRSGMMRATSSLHTSALTSGLSSMAVTSQSSVHGIQSTTATPRRSTYRATMTSPIGPLKHLLLEVEMMDFLCNTHYFIDLYEYLDKLENIEPSDCETDECWPINPDYVPYDIFDKAYNPVQDLPKELTTKEQQELDDEGSVSETENSAVIPEDGSDEPIQLQENAQ